MFVDFSPESQLSEFRHIAMKYKFYKRNIQILLGALALLLMSYLLLNRRGKNPKASLIKKEINDTVPYDSTIFKFQNDIGSSVINKTSKIDSIQDKINLQKAEVKKKLALSKMKAKYDDINNITWYYDKSTPQPRNVNNLKVYFGLEGKTTYNGSIPWLRFVIQYAGDDWLFINSYTFKVDNNVYAIVPKYGEVKTDNNDRVWEWYDTNVDTNIFNIIYNLILSKNAKVRYNGKQYYNDGTITPKEKQAIKNVLDAFEAIGGTTNF